MISTPLRMEKPVRRPIVPPIRPSWASVVTFQWNINIEFSQKVLDFWPPPIPCLIQKKTWLFVASHFQKSISNLAPWPIGAQRIILNVTQLFGALIQTFGVVDIQGSTSNVRIANMQNRFWMFGAQLQTKNIQNYMSVPPSRLAQSHHMSPCQRRCTRPPEGCAPSQQLEKDCVKLSLQCENQIT